MMTKYSFLPHHVVLKVKPKGLKKLTLNGHISDFISSPKKIVYGSEILILKRGKS